MAKFIELHLPNGSPEGHIRATEELREILAAVYRIFLRLESEGRLRTASVASRKKDTRRA